MTYGEFVNASVAASGGAAGASFVLSGTDRRDVLTAVSREVENKSVGRHHKTEFRLNGEKVSPRAAELLLAAYGGGAR